MDFPLCHGRLVPDMDFANGFSLWRELGKTADGQYLPFAALVAIHWTHRMFAFLLIAAIAWFALAALRHAGLRRPAQWLLAIAALQFLTGMSTVFLKWPLGLAVLHNGGAALLVAVMVMLNYRIAMAGR
jgi:heme a synthase